MLKIHDKQTQVVDYIEIKKLKNAIKHLAKTVKCFPEKIIVSCYISDNHKTSNDYCKEFKINGLQYKAE